MRSHVHLFQTNKDLDASVIVKTVPGFQINRLSDRTCTEVSACQTGGRRGFDPHWAHPDTSDLCAR